MVLATVALVSLFPLYFTITTAFKSRVEFAKNQLGPPAAPVADNFEKVFGQPYFVKWILNSLILASVSVAVALVIAVLAAYAIARLRFRGRRILFYVIGGLMAVPVIVMIVPLYTMMVRLGLINTYFAPLIVYTGTMVPYMTFFLVGFFSQLPRETLEAGQIDGCTHAGLLRMIVVPLAAPALAAMAIVNFLWVWNELLISLVLLQQDDLRTLAVGLTVFRDRFSVNVPATAAGLVIAIIPTLTLYLIGQRYFVRGLTMGGVKGE